MSNSTLTQDLKIALDLNAALQLKLELATEALNSIAEHKQYTHTEPVDVIAFKALSQIKAAPQPTKGAEFIQYNQTK